MFDKNRRLFVAVFSALTVVIAASSAQAQDQDCFTVMSLEGQWALVTTFGSNVGVALGERVVDENGAFTGFAVVNAPNPNSTTGGRTLTRVTQAGFFTVNCDGTGTITRILNGTTSQIDDFVITKSIVREGRRIATAIEDAQEVPSAVVPGGIFVIRVHTRLPERHGRERDDDGR